MYYDKFISTKRIKVERLFYAIIKVVIKTYGFIMKNIQVLNNLFCLVIFPPIHLCTAKNIKYLTNDILWA